MDKKDAVTKRIEIMQNLASEIYKALDKDPNAALKKVRALVAKEPLSVGDIDSVRSGLLIDIGSELHDSDIVSEGVDICRTLLDEAPDRLDVQYNLANGLSVLAQNDRDADRSWYLATSDYRREARRLFENVAKRARDFELISSAKTNQANLLAQSHRWLEAFEAYQDALRHDPSNGIASSGIVKILRDAAKRGLGDADHLQKLSDHYLRLATRSKDSIIQYGGQRAWQEIGGLPEQADEKYTAPDYTHLDGYPQFVAEKRLSLSLTVEGLDPNLKRWDSLLISSITEDINKGSGVPPLFAMFNLLKADFLAARWQVYQALEDTVPESGAYLDTLDYAVYGVRQSLLTLAQRAAVDLLDRVAVATSEYLELPGKASQIYFWKRWHVIKDGKFKTPLEWQPEIEDEITQRNIALIALSELAEDISSDGFLYLKKTLRHASTHRFVVLHDLGKEPSRHSKYIEHYELKEFEQQVIETLRIVRAALLYFVELVARRESRKAAEGKIVAPLFVPTHHHIRGDHD